MIPTWRELLSIPMGGLGQFSKRELEHFLIAIKREIQTGNRRSDQLMVVASVIECQSVDNDREAEMVRRGLRLGVHFASLHRDAFYKIVQATHREAGQVTKAKKLEARNNGIVDSYKALRSTIGCLNARQKMRDEHSLTIRQVNNILKKAGVYKKR